MSGDVPNPATTGWEERQFPLCEHHQSRMAVNDIESPEYRNPPRIDTTPFTGLEERVEEIISRGVKKLFPKS